MSDAGITNAPRAYAYGQELQRQKGEEPWEAAEAMRQSSPPPLHVKPDMAGAAACLSAKLDLARMAAAFIYQRVIITEQEPTKWANDGQLRSIITIAHNFAKSAVASIGEATALVPEPILIIAALRLLHAPAGHTPQPAAASVHHNTAA